MSFLLQNPKQRSHGRVARRIGHALEHFGRRRQSFAVENVHDLALATAQVEMGDGHGAKKLALTIGVVKD